MISVSVSLVIKSISNPTYTLKEWDIYFFSNSVMTNNIFNQISLIFRVLKLRSWFKTKLNI